VLKVLKEEGFNMSKRRRQNESSSAPGLFSVVEELESADVRVSELRLKATASESNVAKSKAAQSQTHLTKDLLGCRILLQGALTDAATTTRSHKKSKRSHDDEQDTDSESNNSSDSDNDDSTKKIKETMEDDAAIAACDELLVNLLEARKHLFPGDSNEEDDDDDSSEDESGLYDRMLEEVDHDELEQKLQSEYEHCRQSWREVLNRRYRDLRLHSGLAAKSGTKFNVVDQSFWDQVTATVSHERIMKVTTTTEEEDGRSSLTSSQKGFDDSKVYQQLLKDFISTSAEEKGDAAAERLRRAMEKKNRRAKNAKVVDRKASKGRKIRYTVNAKLTNFTFPIARRTPAIDADNWFRSLFGGTKLSIRK
jgi:hypothetical protein